MIFDRYRHLSKAVLIQAEVRNPCMHPEFNIWDKDLQNRKDNFKYWMRDLVTNEEISVMTHFSWNLLEIPPSPTKKIIY